MTERAPRARAYLQWVRLNRIIAERPTAGVDEALAELAQLERDCEAWKQRALGEQESRLTFVRAIQKALWHHGERVSE